MGGVFYDVEVADTQPRLFKPELVGKRVVSIAAEAEPDRVPLYVAVDDPAAENAIHVEHGARLSTGSAVSLACEVNRVA